MKHVIIGAGAAGVTAAQSIKEIDKNAEVIVIGEERYFPYKRYLLTEFLCGSIERDELIYSPMEELKELGINLRKGQFVKLINPAQKTIKLSHNEVLHYDKLLIATGGRPGLGPVLKPFKQNIQRYYSLKDILMMQKKIESIRHCLVYGGGLSSLDLLCGLNNLGKEVTYVVKGDRVDLSLVESEFAGELQDFLTTRGIKIITQDRVVSVEKQNQHYRVETLKQQELFADIVFAWDYYKPKIGLIKGTDIEKKLGILVNQRLETSNEDIYAAGDCVEIYHPGIKDYWINFGWPNALDQGAVAGKNMAGGNEQYQVNETIVFNLMGKALKARWWK
ncbi:MAG: FAD-dependent oxidoreductase [bacterium]|nr:FAD-dependent oxidoreductase [bacterium]